MTNVTTAVAARPGSLSHRQILVVFSGLVLGMLLAALDSTIVSTALPTIVGELGGLARLSWVVTAYLLAQTIVTPLYGKLGDLYGRKSILQSAIILFLAGSALCGLSRNMTQLIVFRAIQGLGGGGLTVTTMAVVGDIVPPRDRGRYQGIFGAVFGLASIAGPLLGGYFTPNPSWRWIFYVNLPLGIFALVVIAATLPSTAERRRPAIDYAGTALLAIALSAIVLVSDVSGTLRPLMSPMMLSLIAVAVLPLVAFVLVERRASEPVLPLRLFANRTFSITSAVGLIVGFALFGSVTYLPLYLQVVNGVRPPAAGVQVLPSSARVSGHGALNPETMSQLSPALRAMYVHAFTLALGTIFAVATGVALLGFLLTWLVPERPLRQTVAAASAAGELGEAFAMPADAESEGYVLRGLATLADRDVQRRHIERIARRAGVDISPLAATLLVRLETHPETDAESLGKSRGAAPEQVRAAVAELSDRGLITETSGGRRGARWNLTAAGCDTLNKLVAARRAHLAELFAEWGPTRREELAAVLRRLADEVVPEVHAEPAA